MLMKVICWKGKGLEKCMQNVTKCIHCQQKCTQYVYRSIYICTIKRKTSFTVSSLHVPHHWRSDISPPKHHHIKKAQSMVWRRFYKYTCHVSTSFCTCNFSSLCMILKLLSIPTLVNISSPVSHGDGLFFQLCALWPNNSTALLSGYAGLEHPLLKGIGQ